MSLAVPSQQIEEAYRNSAEGFLITEECIDLTAIYDDHCSLCIWMPPKCAERDQYARQLALQEFELKQIVSMESLESDLHTLPMGLGQTEMKQWIGHLVEIFSTLFELDHVGLRISGRKKPMCPKLHVDHVPARLVHSLHGEGCDWLGEPSYFTAKERESLHIKDWIQQAEANHTMNIKQAPRGSVAIMKGTRWKDNCLPIIHRSPKHDRARLVLTLDFV